jgi:hypothetical protein
MKLSGLALAFYCSPVGFVLIVLLLAVRYVFVVMTRCCKRACCRCRSEEELPDFCTRKNFGEIFSCGAGSSSKKSPGIEDTYGRNEQPGDEGEHMKVMTRHGSYLLIQVKNPNDPGSLSSSSSPSRPDSIECADQMEDGSPNESPEKEKTTPPNKSKEVKAKETRMAFFAMLRPSHLPDLLRSLLS